MNKLQKKEYDRIRYIKNKSEIKRKCLIWRTKNREKLLEYNRKYRKINKIKLNNKKKLYNKIKRLTDINFKITDSLRARIYETVRKLHKSKKTLELLGCSVEFLKKHLKSKFTRGMNWSNYGRKGWVIDHIRPCASFDLRKPSEQKKCFNYTNLQPLWNRDNRIKGGKYEHLV